MTNPYQDYHQGRVDFMNSETRMNLMRSFAGESQARNRYTFAASAARRSAKISVQVFPHTGHTDPINTLEG